MEPVRYGLSAKVNFHPQGRHPQHQVDPEGQQGKRIAQARRNGWGEVGAFRLEGTHERENVYMTVGRQGRGVWVEVNLC